MAKERVFTDFSRMEMWDYLSQREKNTLRIKCKVAKSEVGAVDAIGPLGALEVQSKYGWTPEACTEVVNGLKLYLIIDGQQIPCREMAWKTLCERADLVSRRLYQSFNCIEQAEILNKFFSKAPNGGLAIVVEGMLSAFLGSSYIPCPIPDLLDELYNELDWRFPGWRMVEGTVTEEYTTVLFNFPDQSDSLLDVYRDALQRKNLPFLDANPGLRFTSSDVGMSAINIDMVITDRSRVYHLGKSFSIPHVKNDSLELFKSKLSEVFAQYKNVAKKLAELLAVDITYPATTFMAAAKHVGITKNWADAVYPAFEASMASFGEENITAHDIFVALADVPKVASGEVSLDRLLVLEEAVGKLLDAPWDRLDNGKPVQWKE